jgi:guanylate kinase
MRREPGYNAGMKYSLRSLMIVVLVLPPVLAGGWLAASRYAASLEYYRRRSLQERLDLAEREVEAQQEAEQQATSRDMKEAARRINAEINAEHPKKLNSSSPAPNPPKP